MVIVLNVFVIILFADIFFLARSIISKKINEEFAQWAVKEIKAADTKEDIEYPNKVYTEFSVVRFIVLHLNQWTFKDVLIYCKKKAANK